MKERFVCLLPALVLLMVSTVTGRADQFSQMENSPHTYWVPDPTPPPPAYAYQGGPPPYYYGSPPPAYYYAPPPPPVRFFFGFHFH